MDLVYIVGPHGEHEDLRFSLRSIDKNLTHSNVHIIGHAPKWTQNVHKTQWVQLRPKYENAWHNINKACRNPNISQNFVLMNDDFFVMKPTKQVPRLNRGTLDECLEYQATIMRGSYYRRMLMTKNILQAKGIENPVGYHLHVPMVINRLKMLELQEWLKATQPNPYGLHLRTLYGNLNHKTHGKKYVDKKLKTQDAEIPDVPFISTSNHSFNGPLKAQFEQLFPTPSQYEQPGDNLVDKAKT